MISVITATYNRKTELKKLYKSLLENIIKDLEWVIVDDGSNDGTEDLVEDFIAEDKIKIKYIKQKNAGKMAAINNGIKYITNPYMFEIDSDDYLVSNFLEEVLKDTEELEKKRKETESKNENSPYGIAYLKKMSEKPNWFSEDLVSNYISKNKAIKMFNLYNEYSYQGELLILFKTSIRKKYTYEVEEGEKFITEAYLHNKLDNEYGGVYLKNKVALISEYMEDGYTKNINKVFFENPKGYFKYYKSNLNMDLKNINFKKKISFVKNYLFFGYILKKNIFELTKDLKWGIKILIYILYIPGYIKYVLKFKK